MRVLVLLLTSIVLCGRAEARITPTISIDSGIKGANAVFFGTVGKSRVVRARVPGPFGSTVEDRALSVRVRIAYAGVKVGQRVTVSHPRVLPSSALVINGFAPAELLGGHTYLFFVRRAGRVFELVAVEDAPAEISTSRVRAVAKSAGSGAPIDRLVRSLRAAIDGCLARCGTAIWKLDGSRVHEARITGNAADRKAYVATLLRISKRSTESNTLTAAYTVLGRLTVTSVIPRIVAIATSTSTRIGNPSDAVTWLQGFSRPLQIKALQQIVARAKDPYVLEGARYRLGYLQRHP